MDKRPRLNHNEASAFALEQLIVAYRPALRLPTREEGATKPGFAG